MAEEGEPSHAVSLSASAWREEVLAREGRARSIADWGTGAMGALLEGRQCLDWAVMRAISARSQCVAGS